MKMDPVRSAHAVGECSVPVCFIVPPYLLSDIATSGPQEVRIAAARTLTVTAALRARRATVGNLLTHEAALGLVDIGMAPPSGENLTVYDAQHGGQGALPGVRERGEGDPAAADTAINEAFDGADQTFQFYRDVLGRNSLNDQGLEIVSSVHFETNLDNAYWNGSQMLYGDGSGHLLAVGSLTKCIDVIGHELTHGVTQFTARLSYQGQSGALNESMSDVFGTLVKQYVLKQSVDQADWLIGAGILAGALKGAGLRSLKAPGTAYQGDRQPADMAHYAQLPIDDDPRHDHGGVHINSGIPNHAFYLAATAIGGYAWEKTGQVWYRALTQHLQPDSDFAAAAQATVEVAGDMFTAGGSEQEAIKSAWQQVGVL
jgi:Zn-dependent metalloprotease